MKEIVLRADEKANGSLILVNRSHPLPASETGPACLLPVIQSYPDILLEAKAATLLGRLLDACGSGGQIVPVSGYRTHAYQETLYADSLKENGEDFTRQYVAWPGCSEHETGLAIDLGLADGEIDFIRPDFPNEGVCAVFRKLAAEYGFIERYKAGKERITGISPEEWHFRYVGCPHATVMVERNLCLEEYIDLLHTHIGPKNVLETTFKGQRFAVFWLPAENAYFSLPDEALYLSSGDNAGGFVVTVWESVR